MFNEIMLSVSEFLGNEKNTFSPTEDTGCMVKYISLGYDIPAENIHSIKTIKLPAPMYDIVMVDINDKNMRINDFALYDGRIVKIISCNVNEIKMCNNDFIRVALVLAIFGDIINSIIEMNMHVINNNQIAANISFSNILYYAPLMTTVSYVQTYYPFITDDILFEVLGSMYTKATENTISSARRLVTEFTIKSLLDECVWYGVNNTEYPDIRCNEVFNNEDDGDWEQLEWDEDPFEGDEPNEDDD